MDELNIVSASTYEFLNNAYDKLMDKHTNLIEENERIKKCYYTINESWKELQIENAKLHKVVKYIQVILDKPFSVYLISRSEYKQLKKLIYDVENLEVVNEEVYCSDISSDVNSNSGSLSDSTSSISNRITK